MSFKDYFSKQSDLYLKYRPNYPDSLYNYLSSLCKERLCAWDCGTGNGQAAVKLADYFNEVIATDPSIQQIGNAIQAPNVRYAVTSAESSGLQNESVNLITVANALHWFRLDDFFAGAQRILTPGGILAMWCYGNPEQSAEINEVITDLHDRLLGDYWLPENRLVEKKYSTISFPFTEIVPPPFKIERELSYEELLGLLNTWSAVQRYKDKNGINPVSAIEDNLSRVWPDKTISKLFTWDLTLKVRQK